MAQTTVESARVAEVLAELAALEEPRVREVNANHGDDHGVNLGKLRAVAKRLKTDHELALELWTPATARRDCWRSWSAGRRRSPLPSWTP